jgi:membrane protein DedA with SNARE-associated domain
MLTSFVLRWGYVAVGLGTFVEGEAMLIAAGALAHRGLLSLPLVMAAAFVGAVAGDQLWFHLGRRFGRPFIERRARWKRRAARADACLARYGTLFVLGFRFIYGIRTATPVFLGASAYSTTRFALLNVAGAAIWAILFGSVGWGLGASFEALLRRAARVEELLGAILALAVATWIGGRWIRHRTMSRTTVPLPQVSPR